VHFEVTGDKMGRSPRRELVNRSFTMKYLLIGQGSMRRQRGQLSGIFIALALLARIVFPTSVAGAPSVAQIASQLEAGTKTTHIVCFGDSITGVYYHTGSARAWPDMLGIALQQAYPKAKLEMVNAGISGNTTIKALARIEKDVIAKKPEMVIIMFGMNDVARVKIDDFELNLRDITQKCLDAGAAVILCTPNSVYENPTRPNVKLAAYSDRVRTVAHDFKVPLVDFFKDWSELHQHDPNAWMLLMSEIIHPNLNGHKRFAELITHSLSGKKISLADVEAAPDPLQNTRELLRTGQTVKLLAMPPYDKVIPVALKKGFPDANIEVTSWPVEDQSLAQIRKWSQKIREMSPNLVVINVPPDALTQPDEADFIRDYGLVLNNSFPFGKRQWEVLAFLPDKNSVPAQRLYLARQIIIGKDLAPLSSLPDDLIAK